MWPRVIQVGSWIAAALAAPILLVALYWIVIAWIGMFEGVSTNAAGRTLGAAMVGLSLALLLATPLSIRKSGRGAVGCVVAAVVVFGTCILGLALILGNAY